MKTFVIGDIHGSYKGLLQCLQRSSFNYSQDRLIVLGDVCDGYPQVKEAIDELLKIKHCDYIIGNHDLWALDWSITELEGPEWLDNGGHATVESYQNKVMPDEHIDFLNKAEPFLEIDDSIFVHGGFDPNKPIDDQEVSELTWNRALIEEAFRKNKIDPHYQFSPYKEIYVGHTSTHVLGSNLPLKLCNLWALDTGAGWSGKMTIMDIKTKQYWQSDPTPILYPAYIKRGH